VADGSKPPGEWRLGTEHEKFAYSLDGQKPLSYEGSNGISAFLKGLQKFGWEPVLEGDNVIALRQKNKGSITLEPGGQLELSGAPLETVHQTCGEVNEHRNQIKEVAKDLNIGLLGLGFSPNWSRDVVNWMPKGRYNIMRRYMPKVGNLGLDMMLRTCTVQVNLDYQSEADMVKKVRVALALQPVATALWANSPFTEGKPNGYLSYRAHVWQDTDARRTGILPFVFDESMSFERYVDYVLDVPMYFVYRNGYVDAAGNSFRDFMDGRLPAMPGELPTMLDWENHLSTVFPEVRIKSFIELRGADSGPWDRLCALPAFWAGLLYDTSALDAAWDIVRAWAPEDRDRLYRDVPKLGLQAEIIGKTVQDLSHEILNVARHGLSNRARLDTGGNDETGFLTPLQEIVNSGITPAESMLRAYHERWKGDVTPLFDEFSY